MRRNRPRRRPDRFPPARPLPDTSLWYVLHQGDIHGRIGHAAYRTALGIARAMLPELADELRLVLYAEVPRPVRADVDRAPLWTPAWCTARGIAWAQGLTAAGGAR